MENEYIYKIVKDKDGVDCYIKTGQIVRCRDCEYRSTDDCPMYFEEQVEWEEDGGYIERGTIHHDHTEDDGFCDRGERREDD